MADDKKEDSGTKALTMGDLKKFVEDTVGSLIKSGKDVRDDAHDKASEHTANKLDRSSNIQEQVQAELAKIKEKEDRDKKESERDTLLSELQEKLKGQEKAPVERRRVHKIMGWGE